MNVFSLNILQSGAGKTEASKQIQAYIAAVSGQGEGVDKIKKIFLESNPGSFFLSCIISL